MKAFIAVCCLVFLSACSLFSGETPPEEDKPKELSAPATDLPESDLLSTAKRNYRSGLFSVAKDSFDNLRNNYPLGPYAEFAEIKGADSRYEGGEYDAAAPLYEEFTKNRPASPAVPWMLLRAGRSYQLSNRGVGRDPASLTKAEDLLTRLVKDYPDSVYTSAAKAYLAEVKSLLAEHEQTVIDFYRRKDKTEALAARTKQFEQRFGVKSDEFVPTEHAEVVEVPPLSLEQRRELQQLAVAHQVNVKPVIDPPP